MVIESLGLMADQGEVQGGPVEGFEEASAGTLEFFEGAVIKPGESFTDGLVEFGQAEESPMT